MRVKKYKRVKRPKIYVELPGSVGDDEGTGGKAGVSVVVTPDHPEVSDNAATKGDDEIQEASESISGEGPVLSDSSAAAAALPKPHLTLQHGNAPIFSEESMSAHEKAALPSASGKNVNEKISYYDLRIEDVPDTAVAAGPANEDGRPHESPTPRTIACSDVASLTPSAADLGDENGGASVEGAAMVLEDEEDEYEEYDEFDMEEDDASKSHEDGKVLARGGSLWFKAERVVCFLQFLALAADVDGASWPPLFSRMWRWTWFTNDYMRWPLIVLLRRVGRGFALTFGDADLELWFFRDVVGYGVEICAVMVAVFALFFVLAMPDYTSLKPKAAWKRSFLTHWFRRTLPLYVFNLALCYAVFVALASYGGQFFPPDVVTAVIVVGGTLVTVSWLLLVLLSFAVHVSLRMATKHDAEYSFMIAMKHVVKIKIRSCLFFLHVAYVPVSASIVRALLPVFDWNDGWTAESRRNFNHHVWCYFLGFPPQVQGTEEIIVLECTSVSGVAVHTLSACLFLFYVCGLPNMVRYLVRFLFVAFESNGDVIRSFLQAKEVHHAALESLAPLPKDAVWLARRRREITLARQANGRLRRRVWRAVIISLRRVPLVRRLPFVRPRRKKKSIVSSAKADDPRTPCSGGSGKDSDGNGSTTTVEIGGNGGKETGENDPAQTGSSGTPGVQINGVSRMFGTTEAMTLTAADASEKAASGEPPGRGNVRASFERRREVAAKPSRLKMYLQKRNRACLGLSQALLAEREACSNAGEEYVLALSDFESDHSLEITCWESVLDASGLVFLSESYTWLRPEWKVIESLERGLFVSSMLMSKQLVPASAQLLLGALALSVFQAWTLRAEPFLYYREALLDSGLRVALILVLCIGAAAASGILGKNIADTFLFAIGAAGMVMVLVCGEAIGAVTKAVGRALGMADERVNDVLFRQVRHRSLGLECTHAGVRLLAQWDDLLEQQRWSAFLAWPTPTPARSLSNQEKIFIVRWAALRGIDIRRARTSTGLSLLHDSVINAEVEPARWLVYLYPMLLDAETLHKESPLLLGVLETARVLLRIEELDARLEHRDLTTLANASDGVGGMGLIDTGGALWTGGGGRGERERVREREAEEEELAELSWKVGKLTEIFLSNELQNADIRWNAHQYDLLTEHGEPDMSELAQLLAEAFNMKQPKGYAVKHRWRKRARFTREYLGEATCASRSDVDLAGCGLGDIGYKTLLSICRALSLPATTFTWPSTYTTQFRFNIVRLYLSGNRMRRKSGYRVADMLLLNKTVEELDLSDNALDSQAAAEIFYAARKNQVLKKLNLAGNKVGPEVSDPLAEMVMKNRCLTYLDLSDNQMGERKFWSSLSEFVYVPSAGPALGDSLRYNKTLTELKVKGNLLGAETGEAFANGVERHRSLTTLDLSVNLILPEGGRALAMRLNFPARSSLTSLNLAGNYLGKKAGKLFSAILKRNRTLRHLDLSRNELGTQSGIAFATTLRTNRTLQSLAICSNGMGANLVKNMAQSLAENASIKDANFSKNAIGIATAEGGDPAGVGLVLGHGLRCNTALTSLDLSGNRIPALEMQRIAEGLSEHPSLSHLTLAGETLNNPAARDVGRLAALGGLLSLDISRTALAGAGAVTLTRALSTAHGLTRLDISDNSLGEPAARELAFALQNRGGKAGAGGFAVRFLSLARCGLGPTGGALVARALGSNRSVEELDLSDNGLGVEAGVALARSFRVLYRSGKEVRPCNLRRLDISRNPLGNEAGVAIMGALVNGCTRDIDLSYTQLRGAVAGRAIGRMLRCHTIALRHFNVEHNALGRDGVNEVFWALRRNTSLLHLDLSDNGAGPILGTEADQLEGYGTTSIHSALSLNQTLRFLDLGTNGLSAECGMTISTSIRKNRSLSSISLENNLLDDQSASNVARKLRRDHQIEHLNLNNNQIGWRGGLDLADALTLNSHLTFFDAGNNMLGEGGTYAGVGLRFGGALVRNKTLTALNLEGNTLGPAGGVAIAEALHRNNSLVDLNLKNNRFDQSVGFALEDLLKVNYTLHRIDASVEEIGIDSRSTIDNMLAAREKVLERHGAPAELVASNASFARARNCRRSETSAEGYGSDSAGSATSAGREGGGGRGRRPNSARALRARQASNSRKSSMGSSMSRR